MRAPDADHCRGDCLVCRASFAQFVGGMTGRPLPFALVVEWDQRGVAAWRECRNALAVAGLAALARDGAQLDAGALRAGLYLIARRGLLGLPTRALRRTHAVMFGQVLAMLGGGSVRRAARAPALFVTAAITRLLNELRVTIDAATRNAVVARVISAHCRPPTAAELCARG